MMTTTMKLIWGCALALLTLLLSDLNAQNIEYDDAARLLMKNYFQKGEINGTVLFHENFDAANLDNWNVHYQCELTNGNKGSGKALKVTSYTKDYSELLQKNKIPVDPTHPIAILWRTRILKGVNPIYMRLDFFDAKGKLLTCKQWRSIVDPTQLQLWTRNARLASTLFSPETRYISVRFPYGLTDNSTSVIDDVYIVDYEDPIRKNITKKINALRGTLNTLSNQNKLQKSGLSSYWIGIAEKIRPLLAKFKERLSSTAESGSPLISTTNKALIYLTHFSELLKKSKNGGENSTIMAYSVNDPSGAWPILPESWKFQGHYAKPLELSVCPGEKASGEIVLWSPENLNEVRVDVSKLTNKTKKAIIDPKMINIRILKNWYQAGGAPYCITINNRNLKVLLPELLVKDDSLIKTDTKERKSYVKITPKNRPSKYVDIDSLKQPWYARIPTSELPIRDSAKLTQFTIRSGKLKQLHITFSPSLDTPPGEYTGNLTIKLNGAVLSKTAVKLLVLPFSLPKAKTYYNPKKDFTFSLYYWGNLSKNNEAYIGAFKKSKKQFRAEIKAMLDNGVDTPFIILRNKTVYNPKEFAKYLKILQEMGCSGRPLHLASSDLIGNPTDPKKLETLKINVEQAVKQAKEYGFTELYLYGMDEAKGKKLLSQLKAWKVVHDAGAKINVSGYQQHFDLVSDSLDLLNYNGTPPSQQKIAEWHKKGNEIWNYGNPQTPVEDPKVFRRNYGLALWRANFDGAATYCFIDAHDSWNDFSDKTYRKHNMAYPTTDGVVETMSLQGLHQASQDVKFASLLLKMAKKAEKSKNEKLACIGSEAVNWLATTDFKTANLASARKTIIEYIMKLSELSGK